MRQIGDLIHPGEHTEQKAHDSEVGVPPSPRETGSAGGSALSVPEASAGPLRSRDGTAEPAVPVSLSGSAELRSRRWRGPLAHAPATSFWTQMSFDCSAFQDSGAHSSPDDGHSTSGPLTWSVSARLDPAPTSPHSAWEVGHRSHHPQWPLFTCPRPLLMALGIEPKVTVGSTGTRLHPQSRAIAARPHPPDSAPNGGRDQLTCSALARLHVVIREINFSRY